MPLCRYAALFVGFFAFAVPGLPAGQPGSVEIVAARFYRGAGTTLIDGFCRVPFGLLEPLSRTEGRAWYTVRVTVRDSGGRPVQVQSWTQAVPARLASVPGASSVEHFVFAAPAGSYQLDVAVTDSASGRVAHAQSDVTAYGTAPLASDLLLSNSVRRGVVGDTSAAPGEIRKGGVFVTAATRPVLTPSQARLFYYLEFYPAAATTVRTTARVLTSDDREMVAAPVQELNVAAGGAVATSGLDLTGLPPGAYRLRLESVLADTTVVRTADFSMAGFETDVALSELSARTVSDAFANLSAGQLDSLYQPMVFILEGDEHGIFDGLSVEGKRNFLRRAWARRDPTPGTPANEEQGDFYRRIADANRRFREGGAAQVSGWRTDRGRILLRNGEPDEVYRRPQSGPTRPYELWKYTHGRPRRFVFLDETKLGHYVLIYTDDRREPTRADWEQVLGSDEAVQDVIH